MSQARVGRLDLLLKFELKLFLCRFTIAQLSSCAVVVEVCRCSCWPVVAVVAWAIVNNLWPYQGDKQKQTWESRELNWRHKSVVGGSERQKSTAMITNVSVPQLGQFIHLANFYFSCLPLSLSLSSYSASSACVQVGQLGPIDDPWLWWWPMGDTRRLGWSRWWLVSGVQWGHFSTLCRHRNVSRSAQSHSTFAQHKNWRSLQDSLG